MDTNFCIVDNMIKNKTDIFIPDANADYYSCFDQNIRELFVKDGVTEIMINGDIGVYIEHNGELTFMPFVVNDIQKQRFIDTVSLYNSRSIDYNHPIFDGKLPDGSRCNIIIPPISLSGTVITIRRHNKQMSNLNKIIQTGMLDFKAAELLKNLVKQKLNIIIAGGTGTGKTTLLNALMNSLLDEKKEFINERIITIEDTAELGIKLPHLISLESKIATADCLTQIGIRDLLKAALRMRPDRIIIGEIRGEEAYDLLHAMNTGHKGLICTLHANSCRDALRRLETLSILGHSNLDISVPRAWIAGNVNVIIYIEKQNGVRFVKEIKKIEGLECGNYVLSDDINF